jgi:hypothetical protein
MMRIRGQREQGQALVEFSLAIIVFLVLLMGIVDFGAAIYKYNAVSQAAREVARVASVHPGNPLGIDPAVGPHPIGDVVATQQGLVPGLSPPEFTCVNSAGTPVAALNCNYATDSVRVRFTAPYRAVTPLLGLLGEWTMQGTSSAQIQ